MVKDDFAANTSIAVLAPLLLATSPLLRGTDFDGNTGNTGTFASTCFWLSERFPPPFTDRPNSILRTSLLSI